MSLQLEGGPPHRDERAEPVALVLSGFRNDLARRRVLLHLQKLVGDVPEDLPLPFTVLEQLDAEAGARLCDELREVGAIVSVTRPAGGDELPPEPPDIPTPIPSNPWELQPRRVVRLLGHALRIPLLVFAGMSLFVIVRLLQRDGEFEVVHVLPVPPARVATGPPVAAAPQGRDARAQAARNQPAHAHIKRLIAQDQTGAALAAIEDALAVGEDPAMLALRGDAYVKMSNWEAARGAYERAIALESKDGQVFMALAGIYRQQGRQSAAVDMLHRAKEHGAGGREFESLVSVVKMEQDAESDFGSVTSPHFTISFDEGEDDAIAQLILSQLEDAYLNVGHKLGTYPSHRTPVVLYSARDFQRVTHAPGWAGALYDGRIKVPVRGLRGATPDLAGTLRHEYAHALINSIAGERCPVWLHEGVAMWAEEEREGEREDWALGAINMDQPVSLARLEKSFARLSGRQAIAAYAQSYLAVRHIVARYGHLPLQKLLEAFASHASTAEAFREALSIELSTFEEELRAERDDVG